MYISKTLKKAVCICLAMAIAMQFVPVRTFSEETAQSGLCEHHTVHENCGYTEAVPEKPCTHEHNAACFESVTACVHVHGECGFAAAVPGTDCMHIHNDECGFCEAVPGADCTHTHDAACGYAEGVAGSACGYSHEGCCETPADCTAHIHDESCGYAQAVPEVGCAHTHDDICGYREAFGGAPCSHTHNAECGYSEGSAEIPCDHVCTAESGCVTLQPACGHIHDESCGYAEAVAGQACSYECAQCAAQKLAEENALADRNAADAVKALMDALPSLETIRTKSAQEQLADYNQVQAAYDAYCALTDDQRALLPEAEDIFRAYFEYFNAQVALADGMLGGTCGENASWMLEDGVLTISGTGPMENYGEYSPPWQDHLADIAQVVIQTGITSVGEYAFRNSTNLKQVSIPDSVDAIGQEAFRSCYGLEEISIPESVIQIAYATFADCSGLAEVKLPDTVAVISDFAFAYCPGLTEVTLPSNVFSIAYDAFYDCTGLASVTLPNDLGAVSEGAFRKCSSLTMTVVPETVWYIGPYAFMPYHDMRSVHFSGNFPQFSADAFAERAAIAHYPAGDPTWTEAGMQNYGGSITWVPSRSIGEDMPLYEPEEETEEDTLPYEPDKQTQEDLPLYETDEEPEDAGQTAGTGCGDDHSYKAPEFVWGENNSCTAVFTCRYGDDTAKVLCEISTQTVDPTAASEGRTTYVAKAVFGGKEYTDTKSFAIPVTELVVQGTMPLYGEEETVPATECAHSFTNYVSDNNAACGQDGTKTALCDLGCGESHTLTDSASALEHRMEDGKCVLCGMVAEASNNGSVMIFVAAAVCAAAVIGILLLHKKRQ